MTTLRQKLDSIAHQLSPEKLEKVIRYAEGISKVEQQSSLEQSGLIQEGTLLVHRGRSSLAVEDVLALIRQEREQLIQTGCC